MIDFGELTKRTVHVGVGGGRWVEVPMLTVADYEELGKLQQELLKLNGEDGTSDAMRMDAVIAAQKKLVEMACRVMPPELRDGVARLDFERLAKLVMLLCTGRDDGENDDPEKKMTLPSQLGQ